MRLEFTVDDGHCQYSIVRSVCSITITRCRKVDTAYLRFYSMRHNHSSFSSHNHSSFSSSPVSFRSLQECVWSWPYFVKQKREKKKRNIQSGADIDNHLVLLTSSAPQPYPSPRSLKSSHLAHTFLGGERKKSQMSFSVSETILL